MTATEYEENAELIEPPPCPDNFSVQDRPTANWVVRKIVEARRYIESVKSWAERETRRAQRDEEFFLRMFGVQLQEWTLTELGVLKRRSKSVALPSGTVGFRTLAPKLLLLNEPAAIQWARGQLPTSIKTTESISKTAINEHFDNTGEIPDGTTLQPGGEKFYVK